MPLHRDVATPYSVFSLSTLWGISTPSLIQEKQVLEATNLYSAKIKGPLSDDIKMLATLYYPRGAIYTCFAFIKFCSAFKSNNNNTNKLVSHAKWKTFLKKFSISIWQGLTCNQTNLFSRLCEVYQACSRVYKGCQERLSSAHSNHVPHTNDPQA